MFELNRTFKPTREDPVHIQLGFHKQLRNDSSPPSLTSYSLICIRVALIVHVEMTYPCSSSILPLSLTILLQKQLLHRVYRYSRVVRCIPIEYRGI